MIRVEFVCPEKLMRAIRRNHDFYKRFCHADWKARHVKNWEEYMKKVEDVIGTFTESQKRKLKRAVEMAHEQLSTIKVEWFDGKKATRMPFKIACVHGTVYENGLPHTVNDMIILTSEQVSNSSIPELVRTLKHEQTHVFQRRFPAYAYNFIRQHNFSRLKRHTRFDQIRANPDTDGYIYMRLGQVYAFPYREGTIRSLQSVKFKSHPRMEHPYEEMAYRIEKWTPL